jgi:hypothetical protein
MKAFSKRNFSPLPKGPENKGGAMPIFKTGFLLSAPGIKIVTASSFLTSERKLFMGKGLARDLKIKVPGIDQIFGSMILENCGHAGRYGLLVYERWGIFQVRYRFNDKPDLELIRFGIEQVREFAEETNYIIHLEYPGIGEGELTKEEIGPLVDTLPGNVYVWEDQRG